MQRVTRASTLLGSTLFLAAALAACTPESSEARQPETPAAAACDPELNPPLLVQCLVTLGRTGARTSAAATPAAMAAGRIGQPVTVVDSVVGIVLGNRREPFEILLGTDSATAPLRLTVAWKRLARFPVLRWRHGILAVTGTVTLHHGRPVLVLDAEGQAGLVAAGTRDTPTVTRP